MDDASIFARVAVLEGRSEALEAEVQRLRRALSDVLSLYAQIKRVDGDAPSIGAIVAEAAAAHSVTVKDIIGVRKTRPIILARHQAMAAALDAGFTSTAIARAMRKDHSTVLHGAEKHRERLANG